ncbi:MAG: TRAP transporter small permease subunit, partial [Lentisphaeria bacterium]|nr:TRAP transporter small permease subunit [Lentisphaeria bacterium]
MMVLVWIERWCCLAGMWIAGALLLLMVLLAGANVIFRLGGQPLGAIYELSSYLGALVVALALADTQRKRGHVELDLFTRRYSVRTRRVVGAFNMLAGALLMLLVSVQLWNRAGRLLVAGAGSETLK